MREERIMVYQEELDMQNYKQKFLEDFNKKENIILMGTPGGKPITLLH